MFTSEEQMSLMFEKFLKKNFGCSYLKEFQGLFGIPDFIYYTKDKNEVSIVSFELKLRDWRRAAKQAFRYKSFSNIAYVVVSAKSANAAYSNIEIFKKYNIGLAKFDSNNEFQILYKPQAGKPYSDELNQKVINSITIRCTKSKNTAVLSC